MIDYLRMAIAVALATGIIIRVICVIWPTHRARHQHGWQFYGFGYSYVTLGAGAAAAAVAICAPTAEIAGVEFGDIALWALISASAGLVVFDRRASSCWAVQECPMKRERKSHD